MSADQPPQGKILNVHPQYDNRGFEQPQPQPPPYVQQPQPQPNWQQPPAQQQLSSVTVIQTAPQPQLTTVVTSFRDSPIQTVCPVCRAQIITAVDYEVGTCAWLWCFGICVGLTLIGIPYGCCFIPFCIDGCKDATHHCPNCNSQLGNWHR